jgi:adenine-specific DNA-methyltransferase
MSNKLKNNEPLKQIEELKSEIKRLRSRKKYGLVWEEKEEQAVLDYQNKLPILKEVKSKEIKTDPSKSINILIEGDNYHSLSSLSYTHKEKIDVIYIDPPYNTGNKDFIYNDRFVDKEDSYRHSKWLSFMSKRLRLAKKLLKDDGVIFISIDDKEYAQLKLLCDKIFGENHFIDAIIWKKTENIKMDSNFLSQNKDYVLCYRKSIAIQSFAKEYSDIGRFKLEDEKGRYYLRKLDSLSSSYSRGMDYVIKYKGVRYYPGGSKEKWEDRQKVNPGKKAPTWLWSKTKYEEGLKNNEIVFKSGNVYNKVRYDGIAKKPHINIQNIVSQQTAQKELDNMFGKRVFDHPKPPQLIEWLLSLIENNGNVIVLDFFAGSGTTGHAVLELNRRDGGRRKFILCTNNENNIATKVCYPRIQKVIKGYKTPKGEKVEGLGGNLKYFETTFVDTEHINEVSDDSKIKLTYQAGEMIALRENILDEAEKDDWWQIFSNDHEILAIYFKEDKSKLSKLVSKLNKENKKVILYIFSWGKNEYKNEFAEYKNIRIEDIPEPIIEVYKEINKL